MNNSIPSGPITANFEWVDAPVTANTDAIVKAVRSDVKEFVTEGVYPAGTKVKGWVSGGRPGDRFPANMELNFPNYATAVEFATAYWGGDAEQAVADLEEQLAGN